MKNNKKGFTLAELLIVVAIIAVLVAISIPIFSSKLEMAKESTDLANIRAAYAEAMTNALTGEAAPAKVVEIQQDKDGWLGDNANAKFGETAVTSGGFNTLGETYTKVSVGYDANKSASYSFGA